MYTTDSTLVGQRLKSMRKSSGLSVDEVSIKSGVSAADIMALETATNDPGVLVLVQIVKALDGTTDEIFTE